MSPFFLPFWWGPTLRFLFSEVTGRTKDRIRALLSATLSYLGAASVVAPLFTVLGVGFAVATAGLSFFGVRALRAPHLSTTLDYDFFPLSGLGISWPAGVAMPDAIQESSFSAFVGLLTALLISTQLVVVINLTVLLLGRHESRMQELAIRSAVGASPGDLVAMQLAGAATLLIASGIAGAVGGFLGQAVVGGAWPFGIHDTNAQDFIGLAPIFLIALSAIVLAVSVLPCRVDQIRRRLSAALFGRGHTVGSGGHRRAWMCAIQIGMSLTVLMAMGQLGGRGRSSPEGTAGVSTLGEGVLSSGAHEVPHGMAVGQRAAYWKGLVSDLGEVSGVERAAVVSPGTFFGIGVDALVLVDCGRCALPVQGHVVRHYVAGSQYFGIVGQALQAGRHFGEADSLSAPRVAVINQSFADAHFEAEGAIGRYVMVGGVAGPAYQVVGIVANRTATAIGSAGGLDAEVYLSPRQHPPSRIELLIQTGPDLASDDASLETTMARHEMVATALSDLQELAHARSIPARWFALLGAWLGGGTLLLAAYGTYVTTAQSVTARTGEFGVRRALGATRRRIVQRVLTKVLQVYAFGVFLGLEGALFLQAGLERIGSDGYGFSPTLFASLALIMGGATLAGALPPALTASRISPTEAIDRGR